MRAKLLAPILATLFAAPVLAAPAAKPDSTTQPCVDVQIGTDRTAFLECLNDSFQKRVRQEHQAPQIEAPIDVHSPPNQVGTFNETAARQRMGNAFGVSPVPQRPKPVFANPLLPPA